MMPVKFLHTTAITIVLMIGAYSSHATILLSFDPTPVDVSVSDTFSVDLIADIPADEAINSWGLDLAFDTSVLSLDSFDKAPIWSGGLGLCSLDGDEICGNALVPSIIGISTLGTFNFTAIGVGATSLELAVTTGDITEGFVLSNAGLPIGNRVWDYSPGSVNVEAAGSVPEPSLLALWSVGLLALGVLRFKRSS